MAIKQILSKNTFLKLMVIMKNHFYLICALGALCLCSCEDNAEPEQEPQKSNECRLSSFVVTASGSEISGFIDQSTKTVELSYMPAELDGLKNAVAVARISDGATIDPDPARPADYTVDGGVVYTITAEDGETTAEYTIVIAPADFVINCAEVSRKTYGEMGLANVASANSCNVAFSGSNVVFADLNVYDLDFNKVGTLNTTGIDVAMYGGQLGFMSNDDNGVLVAVATPGSESVSGAASKLYVWKDGWNSAPALIREFENYEMTSMSAAGDVNGEFLVNFRTGANSPQQMHHVNVYHGGDFTSPSWYGPSVPHGGADGCYAQMLSFPTADVNAPFVCWDSVANGEYEGMGNATSAFYVYPDVNSVSVDNELPLYGTVDWSTQNRAGETFKYGNHSYGHARAFRFNGTSYVVACSNSWDASWITIQTLEWVDDDPDTEEVDESSANYLLESTNVGNGNGDCTCSAYWYDPAAGIGHVICSAKSNQVIRYDITVTRM